MSFFDENQVFSNGAMPSSVGKKDIHQEEFMSNIKLKTPSTYLTYLIYDEKSSCKSTVLNYDAASSTTSKESIEELNNFIHENKLSPGLILETHAHADPSQEPMNSSVFIQIQNWSSEGITKVQSLKAFNLQS